MKKKTLGTLASLFVASMMVGCSTVTPYTQTAPVKDVEAVSVQKATVVDSKLGGDKEVTVNFNLGANQPSFGIKQTVHGWNNVLANVMEVEVRLYDSADLIGPAGSGILQDPDWTGGLHLASVTLTGPFFPTNNMVRFTGLLNSHSYAALAVARGDLMRDGAPYESLNSYDGGSIGNGATWDGIADSGSGQFGAAGNDEVIMVDSNGMLSIGNDNLNGIYDIDINLGIDKTAEVDGAVNINDGENADFFGPTEDVILVP